MNRQNCFPTKNIFIWECEVVEKGGITETVTYLKEKMLAFLEQNMWIVNRIMVT